MNLKDRSIHAQPQKIYLKKRNNIDKVLDIGGGGEGIIGQLYGEKVIAIDNLEEELAETNNTATKMVMDARNLEFPNESFDLVTFFYCLMYMDKKTKKQALAEALRVLKSGGALEIWDTNVPKFEGGSKDVFIVDLTINVEEIAINTTYGVGLPEKAQSQPSIIEMLVSLGAKIELTNTKDKHFYIKGDCNEVCVKE